MSQRKNYILQAEIIIDCMYACLHMAYFHLMALSLWFMGFLEHPYMGSRNRFNGPATEPVTFLWLGE